MKFGTSAAAPSLTAHSITCNPLATNSVCSFTSNPVVYWQCEQVVRMNASTSGLPRYWLNSIGLAPFICIWISAAFRGREAALASIAFRPRTPKHRTAGHRTDARNVRILSVYRTFEPFDAGHQRAGAPQLEA